MHETIVLKYLGIDITQGRKKTCCEAALILQSLFTILYEEGSVCFKFQIKCFDSCLN